MKRLILGFVFLLSACAQLEEEVVIVEPVVEEVPDCEFNGNGDGIGGTGCKTTDSQ